MGRSWTTPRIAHAVRSALLLILVIAVAPPHATAGVQNTGRWTGSPAWDWHHTAIHMILLPGDTTHHSRLLWWEDHTLSVFAGGLWGWNPGSNQDCQSAASTSFDSLYTGSSPPDYNMFCSGHAQLGDKRVLIAGGTESGEIGVRDALIFDPDAAGDKWQTVSDMSEARWYPTVTRLPSSQLMVTSGSTYAMMHVYGGIPTGTGGQPDDSLRRIGLPLHGTWETATDQMPSGTITETYGWPARVTGAAFVRTETYRNDVTFFKRFPGPALLFGGDSLDGGEWISQHETRLFEVLDRRGAADEGYAWKKQQPDGAVANAALLRRAGHVIVPCPPATTGPDPGWIVFGGRRRTSGPSTTYLDDVWQLVHDTGASSPIKYRWRRGGTDFTILNPNLAPSTKRYGAAGFYDPDHRRVLIYGGSADGTNPVADDSVYVLKISATTNTLTWDRILPSVANGARPRPRFGHTLVFDNYGRRRTHVADTTEHYFRGLMFGGRTANHSDSLSNQLWSLWVDPSDSSHLEWRFVEYTGSEAPVGRAFHVCQKDDYSDRLVVFGGDVVGTPDTRAWGIPLPQAGGHLAPDGYYWADEPASGTGAWKWSPEPIHFDVGAAADVSLTGAAAIIHSKPSFARHPDRYGASGSGPTQLSTGVLRQEWYPFNFVLTDGSLFTCGPTQPPSDSSYRLSNPEGDLAWQPHPSEANKIGFHPGSAAMYRPGRILVAGSNDLHAFQLASSESRWIALDSTSAAWRASIDTMRCNRANHNLVILPNGQVMAVGGTKWVDRNDLPNKRPEIWDPLAYDSGTGRYGRWYDTINSEPLASQTHVRGYHSTALLLPDGRVLSAGGNTDPGGEEIAEIYCPPYLFKANGDPVLRPEISSAPAAVTWGSTFTVCVSDTTGIKSAALIAPGAATHGFDQNQRFIPLAITKSTYGQKLYVTAPASGNIAPPGYYMLFLLGRTDGGTNYPEAPSVASWIRVDPTGRDTCDAIRPKIVSDFAVDAIGSTYVDLAWTETADDSSAAASGKVGQFDIRWSSAAITTEGTWANANSWSGEPAPGGYGTLQAWSKTGLSSCTRYYIANREHDDNLNLSLLHNSVTFKTLGTGCGALLADRDAGGARLSRVPTGESGLHAAGGDRAATATGAESVAGGSLVVETSAGANGSWTIRASRVNDGSDVADVDADVIVAQVPDGSGGWRTVNRIEPPAEEEIVGLCSLRDGGRFVLPSNYAIEQVASSVDGTGGVLTAGSVTHSADGTLEGAALADPSATDLQIGESLTASYVASDRGGEADGSWHLLVRRTAASPAVAQGGAGSAAQLPVRFGLVQNAPNPFAGTTAIEFQVPRVARVKIEVFDLLGRRIRTLTDQSWPAGRHAVTWDRTTERGERLSSGVFLCRMTADGFRDQKKMVIGAR